MFINLMKLISRVMSINRFELSFIKISFSDLCRCAGDKCAAEEALSAIHYKLIYEYVDERTYCISYMF